MYNKFILLLLAVTAFKIESVPLQENSHYHSDDTKKDSFCIGKNAGTYPHPTTCSKFIICDGKDKGIVKSCGPNTNFDPDYKICVWEDIFTCKGPNFCKGKQDGDYSDPSRCDGFFKCVGGLTYRTDCPKGLWYHEKLDMCDYPKNVNCKVTTPAPATTKTNKPTTTTTTTKTTTTTTTTTTTQAKSTSAPSRFCIGKKDGNYVDPTRCDGFISCVANRVYKMDCHHGLWYNVKIDACDWPNNVNCKPHTTLSPTTGNIPSSFCAGRPNGNYADPATCSGYISCSGHREYKMKCPNGLWFNPKTDSCDYPKNVDCGGSTTKHPITVAPTTTTPTTTTSTTTKPTTTTTTTTTTTPTTTTTTTTTTPPFACNGRIGNYPNPTSCTSFISCNADGKSVVHECPKRLHYQPKHGVCVWSYNYPCVNGTAISHTCVGKNDGNYVDPSRCDGYIACVAGLRYPMDCPSGLWYNKKTDQCDYKNNVKCTSKNSKKSVQSSDPSVPNKFCRGKSNGNYADPISCTSYISCSNGVVHRMNCPGNLWYDEKTDRCNYKKEVDCKLSKQSSFSCKGKKAGAYETGNNCNEFYVCTGNNDEAELRTCPKHTNFYPVNRVCVWSYSYSCTDPSFCIGKKDDKYKNKNNCYGFYECSSGRTFPHNCETGLRFNGKECVDASKYTCVY